MSQEATPENDHPNCADCIRQRHENSLLIGIYQRLQDVRNKTKKVKQAVNVHQDSAQASRSFYQSYRAKVQELPDKQKKYKELDESTITALGFELAASLYESERKKGLQGENNRLKAVISSMQALKRCREKDKRDGKDNKKVAESGDSNPLNQSSMRRSVELRGRESGRLRATSLSGSSVVTGAGWGDSSLYASGRSNIFMVDTESQHKTTQSSFRATGSKMDMSKYDDLNLWLYQNKNHKQLEEELYLKQVSSVRSSTNNRSFLLPRDIRRSKA